MATKKPAAPKASVASTKLADKVFGKDKPRRPAVTKAVKAGQDQATAKSKALDPQLSAAKGVPTTTPPTVVAKGKRGFAALAQGVPGHSPLDMKAAKTMKEPEVPAHVVKNLKGLREAMDKYPKATGYTTDRKFGIDIVSLLNTRGRKIAEIKLIGKK